MAQPGSAHAWGAWGRKFESCHPDHVIKELRRFAVAPFFFGRGLLIFPKAATTPLPDRLFPGQGDEIVQEGLPAIAGHVVFSAQPVASVADCIFVCEQKTDGQKNYAQLTYIFCYLVVEFMIIQTFSTPSVLLNEWIIVQHNRSNGRLSGRITARQQRSSLQRRDGKLDGRIHMKSTTNSNYPTV